MMVPLRCGILQQLLAQLHKLDLIHEVSPEIKPMLCRSQSVGICVCVYQQQKVKVNKMMNLSSGSVHYAAFRTITNATSVNHHFCAHTETGR